MDPKLPPLGALIVAFIVAGSFAMRKNQAVYYLENHAPLKLCLFDHGIEPTALESCLGDSEDIASARACVPDDKRSDFERCYLAEQAREQASTHTTSCYKTLFGGVSCTGN